MPRSSRALYQVGCVLICIESGGGQVGLLVHMALEIRLGHLVGRPSHVSRKAGDGGKSTYQQIAVLGIVEIMRGRIPRTNPDHPNWRLMIAVALNKPRAERISSFSAIPRV